MRARATPNGLWPKICHAHDPIDILTMALLFGILILTMPQMLNYLIGIYLVLIGAMGLWPRIFNATV